MATKKQRRQAAARKLQRQMERRREQQAKRRRLTQVVGAATAVVVVVAAVLLIVLNTGGDDDKPSAAPTTPATTAPARDAKSTSGPCKYTETAAAIADTANYKDVGLPPDPKKTPSTGTVPLTVKTNRGDLEFTLDRAKAPCGVQSFDYLVGKKFFDGTSCPRLTTDGIYVLQCGSPSSSQAGGPTYQFKEENTKQADYGAGVIAMAKSNDPGTTGSQFFVIYKNSNGGLAKDYSVVGKVTKGLDIIKDIAAAGTTDQSTDGTPKKGLTYESITASA